MSTTAVEIIEEWAAAKRDASVNMDKIWAGAYTASGDYLAVWGRRGTTYQSQAKDFPTVAGAARWFRAKRAEKVGKGYIAVPFGDRRFGTIPSFATAAGGTAASGAARITLEGVLAELAAVPGRLRRAGPYLPEAIFAFTQTRLKAELLLDGGRLAEAERQACLAALATAREAVGLVLVA
ncbi:MAG: WGR domain-containing protein [Chloroflexi bacterium]|nr:WGR domain-containing protein [Chloroflexota bacterium]